MPARQQHLPIAESALLPFALAAGRVEANQGFVVQAVDAALVQHRTAEFVFEKTVLPNLARLKHRVALRHLKRRATLAVSRRQEEAVGSKQDRLGDGVVVSNT